MTALNFPSNPVLNQVYTAGGKAWKFNGVSWASISLIDPVSSFNTRTGDITLESGDVTGALGFTPYNSTNPNGYTTNTGDVVGPGSATDNSLVRFDTTTGKLVQNSTVTLDDTGSLAGILSEQFDTTTTPPTVVEGTLAWDSGNGTLESGLKGGTVTYKLGQQEFARVYNGSGSAMTKGQVVYIAGAHGNRVDVRLARANAESTSAGTIGFVAEAIANGSQGFVQVSGTLPKLDTSALTEGAALYLSAAIAGTYTTTRPAAPNHTVILGWVERVHANAGSIYVKVDNGYELEELHNVLISSVAGGNVLSYDSAAGVWKNGGISGTTVDNTVIGGTTPAAITGTDVIATGNLKSLNSINDEGGEIFLAKPQTNNSIAGTGVVVDIYQNKIRIFEQGSPNRGAYIDLTAAGNSVGSNLLSGGSTYTAGDGLSLTTGAFAVNSTVVRTSGSYADPAWITSVNYSKLTGTVPTWNQNTTGSAGSVAWSGVTGKPTTLAGYGITDAAAASHTHDYLPLSGGTLTGSLGIQGSSFLNLAGATYSNVATIVGNWSGAGWWGFGSESGHILKFDQVNTNTFVGASDITLKLGTKTVLDSGNYTSYRPPLLAPTNVTSTSASTWNPQGFPYQAWGQAFAHSSLSADTGDIGFWLRGGSGNTELCVVIDGDYYAGTGQSKVLHAGNYTSYRQDRIEHNGNYLLLSSSNELEFFNSAGTLQTMYLQYSGDSSSLRGPGGNVVLHAGNYSSYAVPVSGGTVGDLRINFNNYVGGHSFGSNHYSMGKDYANGGWSNPHYSDLIIGYHTGIRLGAAYSGIRFYNNSPTTDANNDGNGDGGEALLMTIGGYVGSSGQDVNVNNTLYSYAYRGNGNVAGTGQATYHPAGIYSTGTNWLYGQIITNGASIDAGGATCSLTATRANRANGNLYIDDNYGNGVVGVYSSYRYQGVFAMGDAYKLPADGTSTGNLYGMAWSHPNAGGAAGNLSSHGLLLIQNGSFMCALSTNIVAAGNVTAYSDERLKTNWQKMPENYVARLAQVKVGIYDRLDQEDTTQVGVSAQSFQQLLPQAIMVANDDIKTLSVSYGNAALASTVELAKDNVELRARIERLESLIEHLLNKE